MTAQEFSNEFDILYNNIMSNQAPGLDEYEKSVFLTKAQDEIVRRYFSPKENKNLEGYDGSPKRQVDFSTITVVELIDQASSPLFDFRTNTVSVELPADIMMIINEVTMVTRGSDQTLLVTIPISYLEYNRLMSKPYKRPLKSQAWRLVNNDQSRLADLIIGDGDTFSSYHIRYIKRPYPIILIDLSNSGLTIEGKDIPLGTQPTDPASELDPILHQEILQRAVELAKAAYTGTLADTVGVGSNSQTNIGTVTASK